MPDARNAKLTKLAQKDGNARWTNNWSNAKPAEDGKKRIELAVLTFDKEHQVGIDRRHGLIRAWTVTDATGCCCPA